MFGEEHQHVIQERYASLHGCPSDAIQVQRQLNPRLARRALDGRLTFSHSKIKGGIGSKTKRNLCLRTKWKYVDTSPHSPARAQAPSSATGTKGIA
jgi:hypothetical protein